MPDGRTPCARRLEALDPDCEFVIVHDGARPFASADLIDRCVRESRRDRSVTRGGAGAQHHQDGV